jgi:hypothetical protein
MLNIQIYFILNCGLNLFIKLLWTEIAAVRISFLILQSTLRMSDIKSEAICLLYRQNVFTDVLSGKKIEILNRNNPKNSRSPCLILRLTFQVFVMALS